MTKINFLPQNDRAGFTVTGHTDFANAGNDIVCAGVSSVVAMVEMTLNDVLKVEAETVIKEGVVTLRLPEKMSHENSFAAECILAGMKGYLEQLAKEYPQNLIIEE
ncbi:MAG: ribosomal-processing cysteine protease Prp [Eubacteriales bacterium]